MNRYTRISEVMRNRLQAKTGWGRNEVLEQLQAVLNQVADEEISELQARLAPAQTEGERLAADRAIIRPYPQPKRPEHAASVGYDSNGRPLGSVGQALDDTVPPWESEQYANPVDGQPW